MIKKPMTTSFQKYDSTSKEIKTGKVRTSKKNGRVKHVSVYNRFTEEA